MIYSSKSLERLRNGYQVNKNGTDTLNEEDKKELDRLENEFHKAINDDMNMPLAMSFVWEVIKYSKKSLEIAELLLKFDTVLGIEINKEETNKEIEIPEEVLKLVEARKQARQEKNWAESDRLRDLIKEKGYEVKDTKEGMVLNAQ